MISAQGRARPFPSVFAKSAFDAPQSEHASNPANGRLLTAASTELAQKDGAIPARRRSFVFGRAKPRSPAGRDMFRPGVSRRILSQRASAVSRERTAAHKRGFFRHRPAGYRPFMGSRAAGRAGCRPPAEETGGGRPGVLNPVPPRDASAGRRRRADPRKNVLKAEKLQQDRRKAAFSTPPGPKRPDAAGPVLGGRKPDQAFCKSTGSHVPEAARPAPRNPC